MPMAGCHKSRGKYIVTGEPCENAEIGTKGQQQVLTAFRVVDIFNPRPRMESFLQCGSGGFCCRPISSSTGTNAGGPRRSRPSLRRARARTAGRGTARTGRSARGRRRCSHSAARSGAPRRRARRAPAPWRSGSGPDCPRSPRGRGRPPR